MKSEIRTKYLEIRKAIKNKDIKSNIITKKIINTKIYQESKVIALYKNLSSEVDTNFLIDYSIKNNKTVLLPKVEDNNLIFYKIEENEKLVKNNFNILEPIPNKKNIYNNIDLIIVPGIAFDKEGNRLGFGKGYYDRFLCDKQIYKIGICFIEQLTNHIPTNKYDIKMDEVITD